MPRDSNHEFGPLPTRSPIVSAVILLAMYVAMYMAVAAVISVLDPQNEHAVAPDSTPPAIAAQDCPPGTRDFRCTSD